MNPGRTPDTAQANRRVAGPQPCEARFFSVASRFMYGLPSQGVTMRKRIIVVALAAAAVFGAVGANAAAASASTHAVPATWMHG